MSKKKKVISPKKTAPQRVVEAPATRPAFHQLFEKNAWVILLSCLAIIGFVVFKDFLLFNNVYLYKDIGSDSLNANYTHGYQVAHYMQHESIVPKWSFYQGMGQNILPFSYSDPFYFILMLFGAKNLAFGIAYMEMIKMFCAGIAFFLYLRKMRFSAYASVAGSLLYAFSGFAVLGSCWTIFSTQSVYLALLLLSFEKLYRDNKGWLFPVSVCLIAIQQPFDLFIMGLFLIAYILFRFFCDNPFDLKKLSFLFLKIVGSGALGLLMSSFLLIPNILQMLESPRVSGEASFFGKLMSTSVFALENKVHNVTAAMRLFSNDMMGTGSNYKGWYNYLEAPLFYCGLVNLLLVPQVFGYLDKRRKIIFAIFLAAFILPVIFPFFRYTFWAFTGNYYRIFSFFIAFILMLYSVNVLSQTEKNFKIRPVVLAVSLVLLLVVLFFDYVPGQEVVNTDIKNKAALFLVMYAVLLFLFNLKQYANVVKAITLLLIVIELISFSNTTVNDRLRLTGEEVRGKVGFNDYSVDAVAYLKSIDKSFYRIVKEYPSGLAQHSSTNDAQVQNFFGTPSYNSFNQLNYIRFLSAIGVVNDTLEYQSRWARGLDQVPLLQSFASIKYALSKAPGPFLLGYNYETIASVGDVKILKNRSPLPLGFTYNKFITAGDFKKLANDQKYIVLNKAFVLDDSAYQAPPGLSGFQQNIVPANYNWDEYKNDINLLRQDTLQMVSFDQNRIEGKINVHQAGMLFFSIPFDKGWKVKVDGKPTTPMMVNIGFIGLTLDKGEHEVELTYTPRYFGMSAIGSLAGLLIFLLMLFGNRLLKQKKSRPDPAEQAEGNTMPES